MDEHGLTPEDRAERHNEASRRWQRKYSESIRDIAPLPKIVDAERRKKCERDYKAFCETYFPHRFHLAWSNDHLTVIDRIQQVVLGGGLFCLAMPRGSGKSSLASIGLIWATLYGHRRFAVLVASDEIAAKQLLDSIKNDLESNQLLAADFPEVCYPLAKIGGIPKRAEGQLYDGKRTQVRWTRNELAFPTIEGSVSSGAVIRVCGITGRIRGLQATTPEGENLRPDLCLCDDVQSAESARSVTQSKNRLDAIQSDVLGLSGPGKKIACLNLCTVIFQGDVADELLDKKRHPEWQGHRCKMVYRWPENERLWEQYAELRAESLASGNGLKDATEFYRSNREAMDKGAIVGWAERFNHDEISALQHAYNLRLRDEQAFQSEYQNEPTTTGQDVSALPSANKLAQHISGLGRGAVPDWAHHVVSFIDVQQRCLYYAVAAFANDFTGSIIQYGTWPDQERRYFSYADVSRTLARAKPGAGLEAQIYNGLERLTDSLCQHPYRKESGGEVMMSRCLIDSGWQAELVKTFCRQSTYKSIITPTKGVGITADRKPLNEWAKKRGDRVGWNWRIGQGQQVLLYDSNAWKSFYANRLSVPANDVGSLTLHKASPNTHRMLAEHLTSEYPTPTQGHGRTVNVWKLRAGRDNHLLDCVVGTIIAASMCGATTIGHSQPSKPPRAKRKRRLVI